MDTTAKSSRRTRTRAIAILTCLSIWAACNALVPRQGWDPSFGPVVPHDSFPADCGLCHVGGDWSEIKAEFSFDHEKETGVPLVGAHEHAGCLLCHNDRGPVARYAARGCAGCHEDVHRGKSGTNCEDCHGQEVWYPREMIAMHDRTRFPLVGPHAATACFACHPGAQVGNFSGLDPQCHVCHAQAATQVANPDHVGQGWTTDCQRCHRPTGWKPARFSHPATFPLTGNHANLACDRCHVGGVYTGLSTQCVSCHLDDYQNTTNPNHTASGFSTDCTRCHNSTGWGGGNFQHPATFPLTGRHSMVTCNACHTGGVFTGLSTQCASCHLTQYQNTTNPNHTAAGFSTDCAMCHNSTGWGSGNFVHDFPLAGPHNLSCSECHRTPGNFTQFSCTHCHAHSQSSMADDHSGVRNYSWTSSACYNCHPRGRS